MKFEKRFPRRIRFGWETAKKYAETPKQTPLSKTLPDLGIQAVVFSKIDTYGAVANRAYRPWGLLI
ncbi:hypothetical protein C6503_11315 [Candidatus Poribacteria bacterium]|nr:MAG: hypothetical protein C6503_11315 [Candidatus Poribacteria bacterium]